MEHVMTRCPSCGAWHSGKVCQAGWANQQPLHPNPGETGEGTWESLGFRLATSADQGGYREGADQPGGDRLC